MLNEAARVGILPVLCSLGLWLTQVPMASAQRHVGMCDVVVCSLRGFTEPDAGKPLPAKLMNEIRSQLSSLPFKSYSLADSRTAQVAYGAQVAVPVKGGTGEQFKINIAPNKSAGARVDVMLEWFDGRGEDVLSTKMHVVNGKTVLLGSGAGADSSIIGVRLNCK